MTKFECHNSLNIFWCGPTHAGVYMPIRHGLLFFRALVAVNPLDHGFHRGLFYNSQTGPPFSWPDPNVCSVYVWPGSPVPSHLLPLCCWGQCLGVVGVKKLLHELNTNQ